ncbi:hypothetical protein [Undibacterium squillarum]|uniref:DUF3298 domain-containing protein n=1 Tax=Undibacterium squillarum TaxID=1131567 RepID=A0ABQ2XWI1_9BURK|nr:hypothetical protein [Undibacterium squillarum]GGX34413.1 hypothetical protein GCM10010946_09510 [Undibacterium squillarum]
MKHSEVQTRSKKLPAALCLAVSGGLLMCTAPVYAQSLFGKLVEQAVQKVAQPSASGGLQQNTLSASDKKQLEEDKADGMLDQKNVKSDKRGISGIYFANVPMGGVSLNQAGAFAVGKFLVEYDDATGVATIWTRHSYEATDPAKLVPKAQFSRTSTYKDRNLRALQTTTHFLLREGNPASRQHFLYGQMSYKTDLQGNLVPEKLLPTGLESFLELEPGVLYVGSAPYAGDKTNPDGHNLLRQGIVLPMLVKAGKEDAAKAWTAERIIKQYRIADAAFDTALENTAATADPNLALREPSSELPTKAEMEAAKNQWNILIRTQAVGGTQSGRTFKLVYTYPATSFENQHKKQWVNNTYADTVVSRSRVYVAVFQDQDSKYWTNRFYLVEKAPPGVFFAERWAGNYEYALPASAIPLAIEKSAALKYQSSAKTK